MSNAGASIRVSKAAAARGAVAGKPVKPIPQALTFRVRIEVHLLARLVRRVPAGLPGSRARHAVHVSRAPDDQQVSGRHTIRRGALDGDHVDLELSSETRPDVVRDDVGVSVYRLVDDERAHDPSMGWRWVSG